MRRDNRRTAAWHRISAALTALLVASTVLSSAPANAIVDAPPTFVVASTVDVTDAQPGDGLCLTASGACTLRAAVAEANAYLPGGATVVVPAGTYALDGGQGSDTGDLDISRTMRIVGAAKPPGPDATTVDGGGNDRVFDVAASGVQIEGVVVTNGAARSGAGILVASGASLVLTDSSVVGNTAADQGGGIDNGGTASFVRSTIASNTATKKGGGLHNAGTATLRNTTVHANTSSSGGGVVTSGSAMLEQTTVSGNTSTNRLGGGVQRVGGTTTIRASIIAANFSNSADAKDCSGSPFLDGLNLIGNVSGCNPTGTPPLTGPAGLGPLGDHGGPTETQNLEETSSAVDALDAPCLDGVDQRGVTRPQGDGCDLGSFEFDPLGIAVDLSAEVAEIGAGAAVIPMQALLAAVAADPSSTASSPLRSVPLRSVALQAVTLESVPLRSITVEGSPLRSVPLRSVPLRSIFTAFSPLRSIPLRSVALDSILLSEVEVEGGWEALLANTALANVPLQTLTLADVGALEDVPTIEALTLEDLDLSATRIGALSLASVLLGTTPLRSVPVDGSLLDPPVADRLAAWCQLLGSETCGAFDLSLDTISLLTLDLAGAPLRSVPLRSILLDGLDLQATPLRSVTLRQLAAGSVPAIVDCDVLFDCTNLDATLGDVEAAQAFIGTMADLLVALVGPTDVSWESIDLTQGGLAAVANPQEPGFRYTADLELRGGSNADVDLAVSLPAGFVAEPDSATLDGATIADPALDGRTLTFALNSLSAGNHAVSFVARAGVTLGEATATAHATATTPSETASSPTVSATVEVLEAFEEADPADDRRPLLRDQLHIAHISYPGDVDFYGFEVTAEESARGATVSILLSNLDEDYDLTLYGPPAPRLRDAPTEQRDMLPDHLVDLDSDDDALTAEPTADVPQALPFPSDAIVQRVGARRGTASEQLDGIGLRAGSYWVQVSGANGAWSPQPYALRTRITGGTDRGMCAPGEFAYAMPAPASSIPLPDDLDTVFLVNRQRLAAAYGEQRAASAFADLDSLASRTDLGFAGAVVNLDSFDAVRDTYVAWDGDRCDPDAANDVVRAVGNVIDGIAGSHPDLENIVVVGDDIQIPMARVVDNTVIANERSFADEFTGNNELVAALGRGNVLTDNVLATRSPIGVNDHEVFVPSMAVGRLVETPEDISTVIESFTTADGTLDPTTALVTGYDFLADGAASVSDALEPLASLAGPVDELINETWDRAQLLDAIDRLTPAGLASINAHFDHTRALPAKGNSTGDDSDLFLSSDLASVAEAIRSALLFSMGCHSGLNVSDVTIGSAVDDWAQALAGTATSWVANTGYGYGDTKTVALSEQLMAAFAEHLVAGDSVGVALARAKQQYMSIRPLVSAYDEKVVHEAVLYGMPMLRIGTGEPTAGLTALAAGGTALSAALAPLDIEPLTGIPAALTSFEFTVSDDGSTSGPGVLTRRTTDAGSYYHVDGETLTHARRPVEPLTSADVTRRSPDGSVEERATGVLITGAQSNDVEDDFSPLFFSPTIDLGAHEPRAVAADATFPSTMAAITRTQGVDGPEDRVVIVPGQYRRPTTEDPDTQRLFTDVDALVYYGAPGASPGAPVGVRQSSATVGDNGVRFDVELDRAAERVYVLYKPLDVDGSVRWQGADLIPEPGSLRWVGHGLAVGPVEYTIQAVGADGRVFWADRKGDNFGSVPGSVGALAISVHGQEPVNGWYPGDVTVEVSGASDGDSVLYSLDGADYTAYGSPFPVTGDGAHTVLAVSNRGHSATAVVLIDQSGPTITTSVDPPPIPGSDGWHAGPVTVSLQAADDGSGIASLRYQIGDDADGAVTVAGGFAEVTLETGVTTVSVRATDRAGNVTDTTVDVRIDTTAPTVSCGSSDGVWHASNVEIVCLADDDGVGLVGATEFRLTTNVAAGAWSAEAATGDAQVCDLAGNCTTAGPVTGNKIDLAAPTATISTPATGAVYPAGSSVTPEFSCADEGSGVASCTAPALLPTATVGTYTFTVTVVDVAGNQRVVSRSYSVGYGICLLYDPDQPSLIGSTIPLKLQLCDASGNLSSSNIQVRAVTIDGATLPPPNFVGKTNLGDLFRFGSKSYIYNLDTGQLAALEPGRHTMELSVNGVRLPGYHVPFTLRS